MRTLFTAFLALAITFTTTANAAVWNGTADTTWYTSHKTDTEFTITTAEQLAGLAKLVNGSDANGSYTMSDKTIKLGANIMLNDTTDWKNWASAAPANEWVPIGRNNDYAFRGTFDGNGHMISGLYINSANSYQGLFGNIIKAQ